MLVNLLKLFLDLCAGWSGYNTQNKVEFGSDNKNLNVVLFPYKVFLNLLLKDDNYFSICNPRALDTTGSSTLFERRSQLCLKFAKSCLKSLEMRNIFPLNNVSSHMETRFRDKFRVTACRTERLKHSAVPYMQRLLNSEAMKQK